MALRVVPMRILKQTQTYTFLRSLEIEAIYIPRDAALVKCNGAK